MFKKLILGSLAVAFFSATSLAAYATEIAGKTDNGILMLVKKKKASVSNKDDGKIILVGDKKINPGKGHKL